MSDLDRLADALRGPATVWAWGKAVGLWLAILLAPVALWWAYWQLTNMLRLFGERWAM